MKSTAISVVEALLPAAADSAARCLPLAEAVTAEPFDEDDAATLVAAVIVGFTGSRSGEFALLIDAGVAGALGGTTDLVTALAPAVAAVARVLGPVTTAIPQQADVRLALHRVAAFADHATVALRGPSGLHAALAVGVSLPAAPEASTGDPMARLDMLRGVEMEITAELGRARMTINGLLSLRAGAIVELDRAAGEPADLYVNGRLMARGEVVVVDENYGLRITEIVPAEAVR